jgi:hypothetical protein
MMGVSSRIDLRERVRHAVVGAAADVREDAAQAEDAEGVSIASVSGTQFSVREERPLAEELESRSAHLGVAAEYM